MLGEQLKKLRCQKKLTQKQVAKCLNISPSTYGLREQGRNEPDLQRLLELADFFDVTVDYLLGRESLTSTQEQTIKNTIQTLEELTKQLKNILPED